ncbi:MAG: glycosyltransferase family 4 protein [Caldilineaceae bacterium]|nr:glycosyltransferase family 4 protein [Caldilineaceae bacterium]
MGLSASSPRRLPVVLDAGPAVHQRAGLARYTERLAFHLRRDLAHQVDLTLFYNAHSGHTLPPSLAGAPQLTLPIGQYAWRLSVLASQMLRRPFLEDRLPAEAIYHAGEHLLPRLHRPTVLTVHDLIFERYPEHHTRLNRLFLKVGMPLFVRAADAVIAVSEQTKRDLMELYGTPAAKIQVIYQGIDERFAPIGPPRVAEAKQKLGIQRPYLLMVGTLEPRKNHAAALRTLARLKAKDYPHCLVIVGGKGWLFDPIQAQVGEMGLNDDVIFAGHVEDDDLPALYSGADCLLMPSLYEGFGFPVIEAMACGAPVVSSNRSSLPEVAGDAALLVNPEDDAELTAAVMRVLDDGALAGHLRQAGRTQAARFDWTRCAAAVAQVYAAVNERRIGEPV